MPILRNTKHESYCRNRAEGQTIDGAYTNAGYKPNRGNAARLNAKESIQARIDELTDSALRKTQKTLEDIYLELKRVAFANTPKLVKRGEDGRPTACLEDEDRAAITEMTVEEVVLADGTRIGKKTKLKISDGREAKFRALIKLAELRMAMEERDEKQRLKDAADKTINGTTKEQEGQEDYLADMGERYRLKAIEQRNAAKLSTSNGGTPSG